MKISSRPKAGSRARVGRRSLGGFTLIELLIVMAIIALLAGIAVVALGGARVFFSGATAKARLADVSTALEIYKTKYGEYPPDCCASDAEIKRHILKRWPNALKSGKINEMVEFAEKKTIQSGSPGWTILFWIAGPDAQGFSVDEKAPFGEWNAASREFDIVDAETREPSVLELSKDNSDDGSGGGNYNDKDGLVFRGQPIAYFRAENGDYHGKDFHADDGSDGSDGSERGFAAPYKKNGVWLNPDSFQLILPGEDGNYGSDPFGDPNHATGHSHDEDHDHDGEECEYVARDLTDALSLTAADRDNVANFGEGATIDAEME